MDRFSIVLFLLIGALAGGCVPEQYTIRPGANGKVVDSSNGSAIADAKISVEGPLTWAGGNNYVSTKKTGHVSAYSNSDGQFAIEPLKALRPHSAVDNPTLPIIGQITVEKFGYKTNKQLFSTDSVGAIGTISLQKR